MLPSPSLSSMSLAMPAAVNSSANSRMNAFSRFSICEAWSSLDSSKSWSDVSLAVSRNLTWDGLSISDFLQFEVKKTTAVLGTGSTGTALHAPVLSGLSTGLMGEERIAIASKVFEHIDTWLEEQRLTHWPVLKKSAFIHLVLGWLEYQHRSGTVDLSPSGMHEYLRSLRYQSLPTSGPGLDGALRSSSHLTGAGSPALNPPCPTSSTTLAAAPMKADGSRNKGKGTRSVTAKESA